VKINVTIASLVESSENLPERRGQGREVHSISIGRLATQHVLNILITKAYQMATGTSTVVNIHSS